MPKFPGTYYVREAMADCAIPFQVEKRDLLAMARAKAQQENATVRIDMQTINNALANINRLYGKKVDGGTIKTYQVKWVEDFKKRPAWSGQVANPYAGKKKKKYKVKSPLVKSTGTTHKATVTESRHINIRLSDNTDIMAVLRAGKELLEVAKSRDLAVRVLSFIEELKQ